MGVTRKPSAAASNTSSGVFADFPQFAPALAELDGGQETNAAIQEWWNTAKYQFLQQTTSLQNDLRATATTTVGVLQAEIDEERTVRADADSALASSITSVSASLTTAIGIVSASVTTLASATATSLGFLSANYSITVTAGSVVTGMQLNSSSGGGATSSTIDFQGANFRIWDGSTAYPIFATSVGSVKLANTLTVNTSGKVFIGTGTYANSNTAWYVDSTGQFSLKDKLTWDGSTLTISGAISATTGVIGGWTVSSTTLSNNNAVLDSAGNLLLGTSNDVVILSATDSTYRIWVGNATAGSATFRVSKAGAMTSTSGVIGGFTIGSTTLTATNFSLSSSVPSLSIGSGINTTSINNSTVFHGTASDYWKVTDDGTTTYVKMSMATGSLETTALYAVTVSTVKQGILSFVDSNGATAQFGSVSGLQLANSGGSLSAALTYGSGLVFSGDTNLYRSSADVLKTDDAFVVAQNLGVLGQIILTTDTNLYRASANLLKTDDDFSVGGSLGVLGSANIVGTLTLNTDVNLYRDSANVLKTDDNLIVNLEIICGGGVSASADALKVQTGYFKYGTYVATPVVNTGYIVMKDIFGTTMNVMVAV